MTMVVYWDEDAIKTIEKHFGVKHIKLRANVGTDRRNRGQSSLVGLSPIRMTRMSVF